MLSGIPNKVTVQCLEVQNSTQLIQKHTLKVSIELHGYLAGMTHRSNLIQNKSTVHKEELVF